MANPFELAGATQLIRINRVETVIAVVPDDGDGTTKISRHFTKLDASLARERELVDALRDRLARRGPVRGPAPEARTLAETVCATCQRLEDEQIRDQRGWLDARALTLAKLRAALEAD